MFGSRSAAFLALALASLGTVGVAGQAAAQAAADVVPALTLSDKDAGSTQNIKVGDVVVINLPESASDGYSWGLSWASGGFVDVKPPSYQGARGGGAGRSVGGMGTKTFYLKVGEAGANPIAFVLKRWFDDDGIAPKMFVILFNTAPAK